MNKKLVACIAVVALIVLATRLLGRGGRASSSSGSSARGSASVGSAAKTGDRPVPAVLSAASASQRPPALAHDDDPVGTIRLEGQVIDAAEQPVAGAKVAIDSNPVKLVTTDSCGGFVFEGLIARAYRVEATSTHGYAGPALVQVVANAEPLTPRLQPGGTVEVTVVDAASGAPLGGADVELRATLMYRAVTDCKGVAMLHHVGANFAPIIARAPGYAVAATMLTHFKRFDHFVLNSRN